MGDIELEIFSKRLKELRSSLKMTQKDFARELDITASALSSYEKNNINPSISIAKRIAEKYNVSIDWLCGLSENKEREHVYKTYSELIDSLSKIWDSFPFRVTGVNEEHLSITFYDDVFDCFLHEYSKMIDLCTDGTIDKRLLNLWIKDKENEYRIELNDNDAKSKLLIDKVY